MAWAVVVLTLVVGGLSAVWAVQVEQDDDVLAFLPDTNPDIRAFREINERFGSTDVALVGIVTDDPFEAEFIKRLQGLTTQLRDTPGLDSSLTLTNVQDFQEDPAGGGIITGDLISAPPANEEEKAALKARVMSRDHIVGTLISEDADAVLVLAFATPGSQPRDVAMPVREAVDRWFPDEDKYWGGAPFIGTWIFETTQADMARLTPFAIGVIIFTMVIAFRDWLGTFLGLLATGVGIGVSRAAMALLDVSFNIVLSSMPIILFAVGSAYAIHILSRYDHHARIHGETPEAVVRTLVGTGPTVVAAGLTTVAGLLSFVMMDIQPMQVFGVFTALGLFVALVTSLTFVPALMALYPRPVRPSQGGAWQRFMLSMATWARQHRRVTLMLTGGAVVVGLMFAGKVEARMDLRAFFDAGTEPYVAQDFLDEQFGGSQYLQLHVGGDLDEPEVLREVGRIGDQIERLPHVTDLQGVEDVMALVNDAMTGARRVPDTRGQMGLLYRFMTNDPASTRLITEDRKEALIQVKIGSSDADDLDEVLARVREIVAKDAIHTYEIVKRTTAAETVDARITDVITERVLALSHTYGVALPEDADQTIAAFLDTNESVADRTVVAGELRAFLLSDECFVELTEAQATALAASLAEAGPGLEWDAMEATVAGALELDASDMTVQDVLVAVDAPGADIWREAKAQAAGAALLKALDAHIPDTPAGERYRAAVASKLMDRSNNEALVPSDAEDAAKIAWTVSGMPVLYQGLSRSVTNNQFKSLAFALGLVLLIMTMYYRSVWTGFLATAPTFVTLSLVYGAMGLAGVSLDIGTSMLASIIIGAGVDYGVHLLAGWQAEPHQEILDAAREAVAETSHAIWTNAIMVAAGFFVLTLGDARPLKNVGGLTATAMLIAAFATFVVIPLLANKRRYRKPAQIQGP